MRLVGDWRTAITMTSQWAKRSPAAIDQAVRAEAALFAKRVNEAFVKQGTKRGSWAPLQTMTLEMRANLKRGGGSKALIASGAMRRSITVKRRGFAEFYVGIQRGARGPHSKRSQAKIGAIHELGAGPGGVFTITVTEKMRHYFQFLFWKGVIPAPLSKRKRQIVIPARPFFGPTMEEFEKNHEARLMTNYARILGGLGVKRQAWEG